MVSFRSTGSSISTPRVAGHLKTFQRLPTSRLLAFSFPVECQKVSRAVIFPLENFINANSNATGPPMPCCAVLQNETLYLTSDIKNEEILIKDIESVLFNSKRTGKDNGVQLTYRTTVTGICRNSKS